MLEPIRCSLMQLEYAIKRELSEVIGKSYGKNGRHRQEIPVIFTGFATY